MAERPTAVELLEAVREFIEQDALPALAGRSAFHARVAVNAIAIVERELTLGPANEASERARLATLLGHDGDLDSLRADLSTAIRSGALDERRAEVLDALRASTRAALAIANPKYLGPNHLGPNHLGPESGEHQHPTTNMETP